MTYNHIAISHLKDADSRLAKVIDAIGHLDIYDYNRSADSFVFLVGEIIGQMISSNVRKIIFSRLQVLCDGVITPQNVMKLGFEDLRSIGLSRSKTRFIQNLAKLVCENSIDFDRINTLPDEEVKAELLKIDGVGNWTAKMYLIFFLQREDILPYEDGAFLQAYRWLYHTENTKPSSIEKKCKKWKPYSSWGARYLYRALDSGLTKIKIEEFLNHTK